MPPTLREIVSELAASPTPDARLLRPTPEPPRRAAVFPGAFNPPTLAHLALARAARARGFDLVAFALATRTIDKEEAGGLALEERLHLLDGIAAAEDRLSVLLQNRGLYAEQAVAIRGAWPSLAELTFVVGMDKVAQIFDRRYYTDFEGSLATLFAAARLLVAARGALDRAALDEMLRREPAAGRYTARIDWLDLDPCWREISATAVRERLARGDVPDEWLPANVARYLREHPGRFSRSP